MGKIIVVTSGKGGVGKTTSSASLATGLARRGMQVAVLDFDVGLRNLDLVMGCERRVVYDFVNVIQGDATLHQALIRDKRAENLYILPASQTKDKEALRMDGVEKVVLIRLNTPHSCGSYRPSLYSAGRWICAYHHQNSADKWR